MHFKLTYIYLLAGIILFISCQEEEQFTPQPDNLELNLNKSSIRADGQDSVVLLGQVLDQRDTELADAEITYYVNNQALPSNVFKTIEPGEYSIHAESGTLASASSTIEAIYAGAILEEKTFSEKNKPIRGKINPIGLSNVDFSNFHVISTLDEVSYNDSLDFALYTSSIIEDQWLWVINDNNQVLLMKYFNKDENKTLTISIESTTEAFLLRSPWGAALLSEEKTALIKNLPSLTSYKSYYEEITQAIVQRNNLFDENNTSLLEALDDVIQEYTSTSDSRILANLPVQVELSADRHQWAFRSNGNTNTYVAGFYGERGGLSKEAGTYLIPGKYFPEKVYNLMSELVTENIEDLPVDAEKQRKCRCQ